VTSSSFPDTPGCVGTLLCLSPTSGAEASKLRPWEAVERRLLQSPGLQLDSLQGREETGVPGVHHCPLGLQKTGFLLVPWGFIGRPQTAGGTGLESSCPSPCSRALPGPQAIGRGNQFQKQDSCQNLM
jgi:hypothetical protein